MTNFKVTQVADWGTGEAWSARVQLGLHELVKELRGQSEETEHLAWTLQQVGDELASAFIALRRIKKGGMLMYEEHKEYANLYGHLWAAYKDRLQTFMNEFGYDIGFLFQKDAAFSKGLEEYCKQHDLPKEFKEMIEYDRNNWQQHLAKIRNDYNEHRKLPNETSEKYFKPEAAGAMFDNVWQTIEDIVATHVKCEYDSKDDVLTLYEIPIEERNLSLPLRFQLGLNEKGLKSLQDSREVK